MKSIHSRIPVFIIMALTPVLLGAFLFAQSNTNAPASKSNASTITDGVGIDFVELMRQLDADNNGIITQSEWNNVFSQYDKNDDKQLSATELRAISGENSEEDEPEPDHGRIEAFERLDKNKDGAIDFSEWPGKEKDFNYLDSNRNESMSREEFMAKNGRWYNEPFENLDFDDNNIIDRSEWLDSTVSFNRLDRDGNGVIERREFYNPR